MASVTFDPALGGDGLTVTDDNNPTTGLGAGGHRARFVPALFNVVNVADFVLSQANLSRTSVFTPVRAASTTNITLSGTFALDGVTLVAGDRVLVAGQTTQSQNGIYVVAAGAWPRASDADAAEEFTSGKLVSVSEGTLSGDTVWVFTTNGAVTVGVTNLNFVRLPAQGKDVTFGDISVGDIISSGDMSVGNITSSGNISTTGDVVSSRTGSQGAISGDRNRVINGSCQIVNVASVAVPNNTTSVYGGPEMFLAGNSGAGGQFTQSQGSLSFAGLTLPTIRQTVNTAITSTASANRWEGIRQLIEGFNCFDLRGKPVALSFVFNTNLSGTYSVAFLTSAGVVRSYVTTITAVANTPQQVTIPISAIPEATTINNSNVVGLDLAVGFLNTATFQTATLNAWQVGQFFTASGTTNWGATAGNFIELTNLQLEEGAVATPFIRRSYGVELALTQRYYQRNPAGGTGALGSAGQTALAVRQLNYAASTQSAYARVPFAVRMRATPTVRFFYDIGDGAQQGPSGAAVINQDGFFTDASLTAPSLTHFDINDWEAIARL